MSAMTDWWTDFYKGPFGELQLAGIHEERTQYEVDELVKRLELSAPSDILDAPCGPGRHSLELARRGHRVTGLDFNPSVIDRAKELANRDGLDIRFRVQDLRHVEDEAAFDAVICHWGSFGYFDDAGNADHVRRVSRALRPGGRFFVDTHVAETLFHKYQRYGWGWWDESQRLRVIEERRYDCDSGRMETDWTFQKDGSETTRRSSIRIYTYRELKALLQHAGFTSFDPTDGQASLTLGSQRLWLVARKP